MKRNLIITPIFARRESTAEDNRVFTDGLRILAGIIAEVHVNNLLSSTRKNRRVPNITNNKPLRDEKGAA